MGRKPQVATVTVETVTTKSSSPSRPYWGKGFNGDARTLRELHEIVVGYLKDASRNCNDDGLKEKIAALQSLVSRTTVPDTDDSPLKSKIKRLTAITKIFGRIASILGVTNFVCLVLAVIAEIDGMALGFAWLGFIFGITLLLIAWIVESRSEEKKVQAERAFEAQQRQNSSPQFSFEDLEKIDPTIWQLAKNEMVKAICMNHKDYKKEVEQISLNARSLVLAIASALGAKLGGASGAFVAAFVSSMLWVVLKASRNIFCERYAK